MKKKLIGLGMATVLAASVLAGCGGTGDTTPSESSSQSESEDGETVEVEFWYSGGKTAVNVVADIVEDFNESQDKYHVSVVTQADYDETYQKLQAGIAGGTAPDLALLNVGSASALNAKGQLADINTYVEADSDFEKEDYIEVFYNQGVDSEGKMFGFPAYGTTQVLYYNIKAFEKAGINPEEIETWQDLAEAAEKITNDDMVGWEPMWGKDNLVDAVLSNGGSIFDEDMTEVTINTDEWVEVWESFRQWIHEDKTMKIHSGGQGWEYWYATIDDVLQDKAGGYTGSSGDQADLDFSIVAAMEQPGFNDHESAPSAEAKELVVIGSSSEEEKQGAYEFMKFFTTPENQAKWSMETGYVAVRQSTQDVPEFKEYTEQNPQALVPLQQASHGSILPIDPTGGKVFDALATAADKVEIEGISAKEALDAAQKEAQAALDSVNK